MESKYIAAMNSKTPVSWLQEICKKEDVLPTWDVSDVTEELNSRRTIFKCVLTVNYKGRLLKAEEIENSKKDARQSAAKLMLDKVMNLTPEDYFMMSKNGIKEAAKMDPKYVKFEDAAAVQDYDADIGRNPAGDLSVLCGKLNLDPPTYHMKDRVGPPHNSVYECVCTIQDETKSEKAISKKQAKRRVAYQWIMSLKGINVQSVQQNNSVEDNSEVLENPTIDEPISGLKSLPSLELRRPCNKTYEECSRLVSHKNHVYKRMSGELIGLVRSGKCDEATLELHGGVQAFLALLGQECQFSMEYEEMKTDERVKTNCLTSLIIRGCLPPGKQLVFFGIAENTEKARNMAAKDALDHLRVLSQ